MLRPNPKITAVTPDTIAASMTRVGPGRANGPARPIVTGRGSRRAHGSRPSSRRARYPCLGLGARPAARFRQVTLPLSLPGVVAGCLLVFIPALGSFLTSDLLGGAKQLMIGNLVQNQFASARNWPFGSAASFILMALVLAAVLVYLRIRDDAPEGAR